MKLLRTVVFNEDVTLGELWESEDEQEEYMERGALFYFKGTDVTMLIGDATQYIRPTYNDGGIGWSWTEDFCAMYLDKIEYYEVPGVGEVCECL